MENPKIYFIIWCTYGTNLYGPAKYSLSYIAEQGRQLKLSRFQSIRSPRCHVCINEISILKGSYRDGEPKNIILDLVQIRYHLLQACKLTAFIYRRLGPTIEIMEILGRPILTDIVCTKAILILKGRQRDGEPKNIILDLVQIRYQLLQACKLTAFIYRCIGPTIEIMEILRRHIATVPCLHQGNIYIKRKIEGLRTQKYNP